MPIEIRELVIRAVVEDKPDNSPKTPALTPHAAEDREALIQSCIQRVMQILRREGEP